MADKDDLLSVAQAARRKRVTVPTIMNWINRGLLPTVKCPPIVEPTPILHVRWSDVAAIEKGARDK